MTDDELQALNDRELEQERRKAWYVRNEYYPRLMREIWRRIEVKRTQGVEEVSSDGLSAASTEQAEAISD